MKPHYFKHAFLDCWMKVDHSKGEGWDAVTLIYDDEWPDYIPELFVGGQRNE